MSTYPSSAIMDHTSDRDIMPVDISQDNNSEDNNSENDSSENNSSENISSEGSNSEGSNSEDDSSEDGNEDDNSVSQSGDSNSEDEDVEEFPVHTLSTAERNRMYGLLAHEVEEKDILGSWQFATGKGAIFTNFTDIVDPLFYRPDIPSERHSGLGTLNRLPHELLQMVVSEMDILSLIRFRRVNRSARAQVATNLDFRLVIETNSTSFLALIKTGLAPRFTIRQLATKLGQFECDICPPGNHGFLLFLPALARCCLDCVTNSPKLCVWKRITAPATPMRRQEDQRRVLKIVELLNLDPLEPVSFRPVPGPDRPAPPRELRVRGPDLPLLREYGPDMERWLKEKYRYMACAVIENFDRHNRGCLVLPRQCIGCHIRTGVGPDAVLNNDYLIDISGPNLFSRDTFIEHFKRCKNSQVLWEKLQQGMIIRRPTPRRMDNLGDKIARADGLQDVWDELDEEEQEEWMALWLKPATNNGTGATVDDAVVIEDEAGDTPNLPIVLD